MKQALSKRLTEIANLIPKETKRFADIGSDHAYLPTAVCKDDNEIQAIAGEVNLGPYESAKSHVQASGLDDRIDVRIGDGLAVIEPYEVDTIVIAGMGGPLICSILTKNPEKLAGVKWLVLQPNTEAHAIRQFAVDHDMKVKHESILKEGQHIYEVILLEKNGTRQRLSEKDILFGPFLRLEKNEAFKEKWQQELIKVKRIIQELNKAQEPDQAKISQFEQRQSWIEEELSC